MVRTAVVALAVCMAPLVRAQEGTPCTGAGLLRASGSISPGFLLDQGSTNIYLGGKLEYFTEDRVSFRGEGFWYMGSQQKPALLEQNSQIAFGPFLHSVHGRLDLSAGVEAGISLAHPTNRWVHILKAPDLPYTDPAPLRVVPQASLCASLSYAVWDYFHFFVDARYVHARYNGAPSRSIPLDELMLSAGLGWQLRVRQ